MSNSKGQHHRCRCSVVVCYNTMQCWKSYLHVNKVELRTPPTDPCVRRAGQTHRMGLGDRWSAHNFGLTIGGVPG
ncbi:MAG: hypothetical protein R3F04_10625 [Lysobacteraceae bacterium]